MKNQGYNNEVGTYESNEKSKVNIVALTANNPKKNWETGNKIKATQKPDNCYFFNLSGHWKKQDRKYLKNQKIKNTHGEISKSDDGNAFITRAINTNDIEDLWLLDMVL